MNIVIFGTGTFYKKRKVFLRRVDIVAFIDNDKEKQGNIFEGNMVYPPQKVLDMEFDYVLLMSNAVEQMENQLLNIGVPACKILTFSKMQEVMPWKELFFFHPSEKKSFEKIVVLVSHELSNTGAPIVLMYAAEVMKNNGFCPVILSEKDGSLRETILRKGISVVVEERISLDNLFISLLFQNAVKIFMNTLEVGDLIFEFKDYIGKMIWWLHEAELSYRPTTMEYINKGYGKRAKILAVSGYAKRMFEKNSEDKVSGILPYGIPDTRKCIDKKRKMDKLVFAIIGTISKRKGHHIILQALEMFEESVQEKFEIWIIGKVIDRDIYDELIESDCKAIILKGEVSTDEIREMYNQIDVVVCPSLDDPLPVVLAEGMMNGKVCIASDKTGTAEIITDGENGMICKAGDAKSLYEKMQWVVNNIGQIETMGDKARKLYEEYFSLDVFEKNIINLME